MVGRVTRKNTEISHKHARPFRKRHLLALVLTAATALGLFGCAMYYQAQADSGSAAANYAVDTSFNQPSKQAQTVVSKYGFSISYNPAGLYGGAIDATDGQLYNGAELATPRAYQTIKLSAASAEKTNQPDAITLTYRAADTIAKAATLESLENRYFAVKAASGTPQRLNSRPVVIDGVTFARSEWLLPKTSLLESGFVTYTGIVNGKVLTAQTDYRLTDALKAANIDTVMQGFKASSVQVSYKAPTRTVASRLETSRSWLDTALLIGRAEAASNQPVGAQAVSSLYAPAVVKVYNLYCMDITVEGGPTIKNNCAGQTGSGFFVTSDGYLFTNGHVATANPKDIAIQYAVTKLLAGDDSYMQYLMKLATVDTSRLQGVTDQNQILSAIVEAIYTLPDGSFAASNAVQNLFVGLNAQVPDINQLITDTEARQAYAPNKSLRAARLISSDYRAVDGIVRYHSSDAALLKIEGNNFPVTKLGTISQVSQGSGINILGYPALATDNGIVSNESSVLTLTAGKVSAIKYAKGDNRQLIETDTTIGHGNSGGPAIADDGSVVGIATYTVDGSGSGNGTFNYVRDIQDARSLATTANVRLTGNSQTQTLWEQGMKDYAAAHFKRAIVSFEAVQRLYPDHPTAASFIKSSQDAIAQGKNVEPLPVGWLLAGSGLALLAAGYVIFLIARHHGRHQLWLLSERSKTEVKATPAEVPLAVAGRRLF